MYGHARVAKATDGNEYAYFTNIYSNVFGTEMCGNENVHMLLFQPHANQEIDKEEVEYWGWLNNDGKLSMIWANYFLFDMCFPNGAEASEACGQGKRIKLKLVDYKDQLKINNE